LEKCLDKICLNLLSQAKEHFTHIIKIKLERNSHLRLEVMCDGTTVNRFHPVWTWVEGGPAVPRLLSASQTPCTAKRAETQSNLTSNHNGGSDQGSLDIIGQLNDM